MRSPQTSEPIFPSLDWGNAAGAQNDELFRRYRADPPRAREDIFSSFRAAATLPIAIHYSEFSLLPNDNSSLSCSLLLPALVANSILNCCELCVRPVSLSKIDCHIDIAY